ncbi:hypothetical protein VPH35_099475 [Triticum aestivum]
MIGAFWNIRGLGQPGKIQCLGDFISNNHVDFLCFSETKREVIEAHILNGISGRISFDWHYLPAINTAGGILVGLKSDLFEVVGFINKKFCIVATVKNRSDGFMWHLVAVYGTSYNEFKLDFFAELHDIMDGLTYPALLGGDFNLVRSTADKNNGVINSQFSYLFNKWCLMEINIANRKYTWSNNQDSPIFATIDRVFASISWDAHFPLSVVSALPRVGSDHTPLLLDTGARRVTSPRIFRFEKWWLDHPDLKKMVIDTWNTSAPGKTAMDIWMNKSELFRKKKLEVGVLILRLILRRRR